MAKYIEHYCDPQMCPPYEFKGVEIRSFPLEASYDNLAAVVDKFLNLAPPGKLGFQFKPLGTPGLSTAVYMAVLHYDSMKAPDSGLLTQHELYFAIPVVRWENGRPVDVGLFTPYIFVDNSWSIVCGNMVIGYPKQLAWFHLPRKTGDSYPIHVDAPVFVQPGSEGSLNWHRVVDVEAGGESLLGEIEKVIWPFGNIAGLFDPEQGLFPLEEPVFAKLLEVEQRMTHSVVQLKQVRDVVDPERASCQEIVKFTVKLENISDCGMLPPALIDLHSYHSSPIPGTLGLVAKDDGKLSPLWHYWLQCDFRFHDPAVLWPKKRA